MSFNILIIDDEKELAEICQDILINSGYDTLCFTSYKSALEYNFNVDGTYLLIVDFNIGGKSGLDLVEHLRKKSAESQFNINMPIIFMSGMPNSNNSSLKIDSKNIFFLQKPFDISGFLDLVSHIYSRHRGQAQAV